MRQQAKAFVRLTVAMLIVGTWACSTPAPSGPLGTATTVEGSRSPTSSPNGSPTTGDDDAPDDDAPDDEESESVTPSADSVPEPPESTPLPTVATDFLSNDPPWTLKATAPNSVHFGIPHAMADDDVVATLTFAGQPAFSNGDAVGPAHAVQIATSNTFGYGTYRARLRPAACAPDEEVVNGIFVYANDGATDANQNGMIDNNEIDIEILCGEPDILYLSLWTDYTDDDHFRKKTRAIDIVTGAFYETEPGKEGQYGLSGTAGGIIPAAKSPGMDLTAQFLELGFTWTASAVRFFLMLEDEEITLWHFTDPAYIPVPDVAFIFNVWHTNAHWWAGGAADYPAKNGMMLIDWFQYWTATTPSAKALQHLLDPGGNGHGGDD
ncbi:MAG: glycoside hydrolase family 16 protein [Deltaproteobacteria bacterium]|nr:glycoside hydrolase family 16 protein [Deltaproteobacteria bacterium]